MVTEVCVEGGKRAQTLVLVGRTGNGKSATGNTILGRRAFTSNSGANGVTRTCELQTAELEDGRIINVIDTPGLFDLSKSIESISKEIVRCLTLAKEGIDAVLLVFTTRGRLTEEEQSALLTIRTIFGGNIVDYMILVFTNGDDLEYEGRTLDDYLTAEPPKFLKELLELCDGRKVLFNNRTDNEGKKAKQVQELLRLVDSVVKRNGGEPYTDKFLLALQKETNKFMEQQKALESQRAHSNINTSELQRRMLKAHEEQVNRISVMVQAEMIKTRKMLEQQLAEQRAGRIEAEKKLEEEQKHSKEEIQKLRKALAEEQDHTICRHL